MSINPVTLKKYYLILGNISFGWKMLAENFWLPSERIADQLQIDALRSFAITRIPWTEVTSVYKNQRR